MLKASPLSLGIGCIKLLTCVTAQQDVVMHNNSQWKNRRGNEEELRESVAF